MRVTAIERAARRKMRVFLDGEPAFVFTEKEMARWQLQEGQDLDENLREALMAYVDKRAAETAMELLMRRDYSEAELYGKLKDKGFGEAGASSGIAYVRSWHYLDDGRYVRQQIEMRRGTESRRMMVYRLRQKGVSEDIISEAMDKAEWDDEAGIRRELKKRSYTQDKLMEISEKEKQKLIQALTRKGYDYSDIRQVIGHILNGDLL